MLLSSMTTPSGRKVIRHRENERKRKEEKKQ
jgi:ribosomal protein L34